MFELSAAFDNVKQNQLLAFLEYMLLRKALSWFWLYLKARPQRIKINPDMTTQTCTSEVWCAPGLSARSYYVCALSNFYTSVFENSRRLLSQIRWHSVINMWYLTLLYLVRDRRRLNWMMIKQNCSFSCLHSTRGPIKKMVSVALLLVTALSDFTSVDYYWWCDRQLSVHLTPSQC